jgi:F0F1-type ATP synthase membrane subunit b/b'
MSLFAYPVLIFAVTGIFYIFVLWVMWMIVKSLKSMDESLKEIARNQAKSGGSCTAPTG